MTMYPTWRSLTNISPTDPCGTNLYRVEGLLTESNEEEEFHNRGSIVLDQENAPYIVKFSLPSKITDMPMSGPGGAINDDDRFAVVFFFSDGTTKTLGGVSILFLLMQSCIHSHLNAST